jgi:hypothetical protein
VVVIVAARANERRNVTTIVFYPIVQVILRCGKINVLCPLAVDIVNPPPQWGARREWLDYLRYSHGLVAAQQLCLLHRLHRQKICPRPTHPSIQSSQSA